MNNKRDFEPIHPGKILLEDFLKPMEITQEQLAKDIKVSQPYIDNIVQGKQGITTEMALRLGHFFGMDAQFWMNLQTRYDLICMQITLDERLKQEVQPCRILPSQISLQSIPMS
jgi:addiction module HigA family antidote